MSKKPCLFDYEMIFYKDHMYRDLKLIILAKSTERNEMGCPIKYVSKPLEFVKHEEGTPIEPMLKLSMWDTNNQCVKFISSIDKALKSLEGIKTDNDFKIEGTLETTRKHLQDMRALVFKDINFFKLSGQGEELNERD